MVLCLVNSLNFFTFPCYLGANADQQRAALAMAVLTMIFAVVRLIVEFIQLLQLKWEYFLDWVNYIEVPLFVFSIIFCAVFGTTCFCPYNFQWQFGIIAVLLGWLNLIFFLRNLPKSGIYIGMLLHISRTFLKTGILAFLLILAFSFAFYMAFFDPTLLVSWPRQPEYQWLESTFIFSRIIDKDAKLYFAK